MKSNNFKFKFIENFKYWMLIPMVLLVISIIFGAVFGLNLDYDFRNVSTFNVKFNTTVTENEYKELSKQLNIIVSEKFDDFRIDRIGEGAQNGLYVRIANDNGSFDNKIDELKNTIESDLLSNCKDTIDSSIIITTTDTTDVLPKNANELIGYSILSIFCIMLFVLIYYSIRYNLVSGITFVLTILFEIAMLTIVMIVARVPFNYYFVLSYFVMTICSTFIITYVNNCIRSNLSIEKYNKYSNSERVYDAISKTFKPTIIFISLISLSLFAVMFFGDLSLIYTVISILIGLIISVFSAYMFNFSLWSFWYKKSKDNILKRRIEIEKKKSIEQNKSDEKIIV